MTTLRIHPELQSFIPPLTAAEKSALERDLVEMGGARDPIVIWAEEGYILDGHNRYEICTRHGLPYDTHALSFPDMAAAQRWMYQHQIARRNMTPDQILALAVLRGIDPPSHPARENALAMAADAKSGQENLMRVLCGTRTMRVAHDRWLREIGARTIAPRKSRPAGQMHSIGIHPARQAEYRAQVPAPTVDQASDHAAMRRKYDDMKRQHEAALERVAELREVVSAVETASQTPLRPVVPASLGTSARHACAVALLSDVHAEERIVHTDAIPNEYTLEIAQKRVARFFAGTTWLTQHAQRDFSIDTMILWLGGDLISGDIHEELLETCAVPPMQAAMMVRDWVVAGIRSMRASMPDVSIRVPCSFGNHARTTKKMRAATGYGHSLEWLIYCQIAEIFAEDPNVDVHVTQDEIQYMQVFDATLGFHHGHRMKYSGGIGGITIPATKAVSRWDRWKPCDMYNFGHFHTQIDLGQFAFNGSVIGPSPYSLAIGASPEPPRQTYYLWDAKRGKTHVSPIWVADREVVR